MDDQTRGRLENLRGRATEAAGAATGHERTQARGFLTRIRGAFREKLGEARRRWARRGDPHAV